MVCLQNKIFLSDFVFLGELLAEFYKIRCRGVFFQTQRAANFAPFFERNKDGDSEIGSFSAHSVLNRDSQLIASVRFDTTTYNCIRSCIRDILHLSFTVANCIILLAFKQIIRSILGVLQSYLCCACVPPQLCHQAILHVALLSSRRRLQSCQSVSQESHTLSVFEIS